MKSKSREVVGGIALVAMLSYGLLCFGQGTAITYQGVLTESGQPASGLYDFRAQLYNRAVAGEPGDALVSSTVTSAGVAVTNGLFVLQLDFGAGPFNGEDRWLLLGVRTNGAAGYVTLVPRQAVTATPYAITSGRLTGSVPAGQLSGTVSAGTLPTGGNWALNSTLTVDSGTLAIDPVNNRVGIGTSSPMWPLHQVAPQGVVRVDTTSSSFGSVLELRSSAGSPTYLGAINFNDGAGTYRGQMGYTGDDALVFRTAGAERMRLDSGGRLDLNTANGSVSLNAFDSFPPFSFFRGVKVTADSVFSTAIMGSSSEGNAIVGNSANGYAGSFNGAVQINYASPFNKPQLAIKDPADGGFARMRMQTGTRAFWDLAMGGDNSVRFFAEGNGDVMVLNTNGQLYVNVLTIRGGADIAEPFRMSEKGLPKGAVVVIDEDAPGQLRLSSERYDRRVAGIISGAGGVKPGLSLSQEGVVEGDEQVALTGRVYAQADTSNGPIKPGDLLTTSGIRGHAMRVTDHARAQGAILGKAMSGLAEGEGLVLVLVTLQ